MPQLKLYTPEEVSEILGVTIHTLAVWRCEKRYNLPYVKVGRLVRYPEKAVNAFLEERIQQAFDAVEMGS